MHAPEEHPLDPVPAPEAREGLLAKTPWWSISTGLHVLAVLVIGFFWAATALPDEVATVIAAPRKPRVLPQMDPPTNLPPADKLVPVQADVPTETLLKDPDDQPVSDNLVEVLQAQMKGEDTKFISEHPFKSSSVNTSIGGGGGAAGRHGHPLGGRGKGRGRIGGSTPQTEDAVIAALRWLARHQNPDGSWSVIGYVQRCTASCTPAPGESEFDAGVTGLSLLAFLGAGFSHLSKDVHDGICFGDVVRKAQLWIMANQDPEGCIGPRSISKYMYNHSVGALALAEAYGLTGSSMLKANAQRAIDFLVAAQNPGKGWRYSYRSGDNDSSVTGWAAMALKSAEISGLDFPRTAYDGIRSWFDEATDASYGRVGYTHKNTGKVFIPGKNEHYDHHETLTAIAVMSRIFIDKQKGDPNLRNGTQLLLRDQAVYGGNATDFYYWYSAALALFQYEGPKSQAWNSWKDPLMNSLVKNQNARSTGCRSGSWEPTDRWACEAGRVYSTAINALTLEVFYRYAHVFGSEGRQ